MCDRVSAVFKKGEKLDAGSRWLLEQQYLSYIRNGLNLPEGPQWGHFKQIDRYLTDMSTDFRKNLNEEAGELWFTLK